jgi:hypothetical protein
MLQSGRGVVGAGVGNPIKGCRWHHRGRQIMLNDAERRMLAEIESSLRSEDPRFVQRFNSRPRSRQRGAVCMALITAMTVMLVGLVAGSALGFVVGLIAAVATIGLYATHREDR